MFSLGKIILFFFFFEIEYLVFLTINTNCNILI